MKTRNQSGQQMFQAWAERHQPIHKFQGTSTGDFEKWKAAAHPDVLACLGDFPGRVDPNAELIVEWEHDGLQKQRWYVDVLPDLTAIVQVNRPADLPAQEKRPTLLCWHGHGSYGKEPVMGNDSSPEIRKERDQFNYSYGHQMAQQGFVTFGVDWLGRGDLTEGRKPNWHQQAQGRDWCNLYYLQATMLGMTSISVNVTIGKAATDFVSTLPFVDTGKLGVMGLSGGGTMTVWTAFCDERFRAAEIMCYSDLWAVFGFRDLNYCGMQVAPGLYKQVDLPDLQGLLAPRPLLVDIGVHDTCFDVGPALECYHQVEKIYQAAGVDDRLELDLFAREHAWGGNKSVAFFHKHLA